MSNNVKINPCPSSLSSASIGVCTRSSALAHSSMERTWLLGIVGRSLEFLMVTVTLHGFNVLIKIPAAALNSRLAVIVNTRLFVPPFKG